jgi:hypothetical protein
MTDFSAGGESKVEPEIDFAEVHKALQYVTDRSPIIVASVLAALWDLVPADGVKLLNGVQLIEEAQVLCSEATNPLVAAAPPEALELICGINRFKAWLDARPPKAAKLPEVPSE